MYYERYEASLSSNTCSEIVNTFLQLSCRALSDFLPFDEDKLLKELNDKFSVRRELEMAASQLNLKYREYMAIASAAFITARNINFDQADVEEPDTYVRKQTEWSTEELGGCQEGGRLRGLDVVSLKSCQLFPLLNDSMKGPELLVYER